MPQQTHDTLPPLSSQLQALIQQGWEQEVLCQLPADYEQQARTTRAFVRAKGLKSVADLERGSARPRLLCTLLSPVFEPGPCSLAWRTGRTWLGRSICAQPAASCRGS